MTTIRMDDYVFEADVEKTAAYYQARTLCECDNCVNFYAQISGMFPKLEAFLSEFGVDIARPDEIFSFEIDHTVQYINVDYTVCGKVITMGQKDIRIQDEVSLNLVITDGFSSPNEQTGDYFTVSVTDLDLPWVLDKPFPAPPGHVVDKTSKIKEFFKKIFKA